MPLHLLREKEGTQYQDAKASLGLLFHPIDHSSCDDDLRNAGIRYHVTLFFVEDLQRIDTRGTQGGDEAGGKRDEEDDQHRAGEA